MSLLTEYPSRWVRYGGHQIRMCCSYDNVLEVQRLYRDAGLSDIEKVDQALVMLTGSPFQLWLMGEGDKIQLLNKIYEEQIRIPKKPSVGKQIRSFDFDLDAEYIYASFLQDYGMDLVREQGKLHWKQFVALFQGLTSKTKIKEIMRIRAMDVPEPTGHNQKEIQNIMELKSYYALPVEGGGGQSGLNALFAALEAEAMR